MLPLSNPTSLKAPHLKSQRALAWHPFMAHTAGESAAYPAPWRRLYILSTPGHAQPLGVRPRETARHATTGDTPREAGFHGGHGGGRCLPDTVNAHPAVPRSEALSSGEGPVGGEVPAERDCAVSPDQRQDALPSVPSSSSDRVWAWGFGRVLVFCTYMFCICQIGLNEMYAFSFKPI